MRSRRILPSVLVSLTLAACGGNGSRFPGVAVQQSALPRDTGPSVSAGDAAQLASDDETFAVDLYQALRAQPGNLIYSPASISLALAMLYNGAAGTTASQMAAALQFSLPLDRLNAAFDAMDLMLNQAPAGSTDGAFQLSIANSLWTQAGFAVQQPFLDALATSYGAGLNTVDFIANPENARSTINQWVADETQQEIPTLFPAGSIDSTTRLVLADAVYFHGDWMKAFDANSGTGTFHAASGDVTATMMRGEDNAFLTSGTGWQAATLQYQGSSVDMVLVIPDAGTFDAFEAGFTAQQLSSIINATSSFGSLVMPKFKFRTAESLNDVLSALGMPDAFTSAADFSGIDGQHDLQIGSVVHQADIAVDEQGTTAAAATGIGITANAVVQSLVVDRPFLFFIVHPATGAILFAGRVLDPTAG